MKDNSSPWELQSLGLTALTVMTEDYQVIWTLISSLTSSVPLLQPGRQADRVNFIRPGWWWRRRYYQQLYLAWTVTISLGVTGDYQTSVLTGLHTSKDWQWLLQRSARPPDISPSWHWEISSRPLIGREMRSLTRAHTIQPSDWSAHGGRPPHILPVERKIFY